MVYVPSGCFEMGSSLGDSDELPIHTVCLRSFWISQTEITNAQYQACVAMDQCAIPQSVEYPREDYMDYPIVGVTWEQATQFARWIGGSLPTEAQWEYTARGPESRVYPWGDFFDFNGSRLNFCDLNCSLEVRDTSQNDEYPSRAPVGTYPNGASWVGALDMAGNVWEWVMDFYDAGYYTTLESEIVWNPTGPDSGRTHVIRGGSYINGDHSTRSARRGFGTTGNYYEYVGFRVVIPISLGE
jgi:serine/threonine-protein kinase